jgi:hypothetical protein
MPRSKRKPRGPGLQDLTPGERAYFMDTPLSGEELDALGERWTNYRIWTNSSTFGSKYDGGYGYYEGRWKAHCDEVLKDYTAERPGMRPSTWWRWSAPVPFKGKESTWEYLDRVGGWIDGERDRAAAIGLKAGVETCPDAPQHPEWDTRGRPRRERREPAPRAVNMAKRDA